MTHIEGVTFTKACYSYSAKTVALVLKNVLSIYEDNKLLTLYGFDHNVEEVVNVGDYFFVKLDNGAIYGCR